ncbi:hypothetical protein DRJ17_04610 [Candidatus Woesearchaeota archaeon]|nr:MAG: hypothetical protein DRJ17_04610 [Candidatus Woesearchaeota archaeon]
MRVVKHIIEYEKPGDTFLLIPFGDLHVGHRNCDKDKLIEIRDFILHQDALWIGMGDYANAIFPHPNEKRLDLDVIDPELYTPEKQYQFIYELFEPIKHNCLGLLTGNHDDLLRRRHYHNWVDELAYKLGVPYLDFAAFVKLVFKRGRHTVTIDIFATHGYYSGRRIGGKINRVEDLARYFDADIYLVGHVHEVAGFRNIQLRVTRSCKIVERKRIFAITGTFLRGWKITKTASYAERRLLPPNKIGIISIWICPEPGRNKQPDMHIME